MTFAKPTAVLFDWDDTVVDSWSIAMIALNTTLVAMGQEAWTHEQALRGSGGSARDMFGQLFGDRWQEADRIYYETFHRHHQLRIHDHVEDLFKMLKDNGVYLAVVSNKRGSALRQEAKDTGFERYFDRIVGAGDASADKPNPAVVRFALEGSGIEFGPHVWFIGDSHADMQCAHNAGLTGVLIETKPPLPEMLENCPPAHRFGGHSDIMKFIKGGFF